jgi:cytochrome P450
LPEAATAPAAVNGGHLPPGPAAPGIVQLGIFTFRNRWMLDQCLGRYGHCFTLRLPGFGTHVVTRDLQHFRTAFRSDSAIVRAGRGNELLEPLMGPRSLFLIDGPEHLQQRKALLPALHGERLARLERIMQDVAAETVGRWRPNEPFSVLPEMRRFALEVILRAIFGVADEEKLVVLRRRVRAILDLSFSPVALVVLATRQWGTRERWRAYRQAIADLDESIYDLIADRRHEAAAPARDDTLTWLMGATTADGERLSDQQLRDHLGSLLVAGTETTATSLSWSFEKLVRNPRALRRLTDEALAGEGHEYVDAVVKESLRMQPPVQFVIRDLAESFELEGYELPAGTRLVLSMYLAHRREDLYPDPDEFRPERFIGKRGPDSYAWVPFGSGVRHCVGASFATLEMRTMLHAAAAAKRLQPESPDPEPQKRVAFLYVPAKGGRVIAQPRA